MSHITITQLSTILNRIKTWALSKFAVKNAVSGKLEYGDMPVVVLASMGHVLDGTASDRPMSQGDTYFLPAGVGATDRILYRSASGATKISDPKSNVIYCNAYTDLLYRWDSVQGKMIQVGGSISEEGGDSNKADILQIGDYSILHPGQWPKAIANTTQLQIEDSNFGSGSIVFTGEYLYLLGNMAESGDDDFEGFTYVDLGSPSADVVYFSLFDDCFYRWNSTLARFDKVSNLITAAANSGLSISAGGEISAPGKADLNANSGRLEYGQAPIVVLVSMGSNFDDGNNVLVGPGEPFYNPTTQKITIRGGSVDPISGETTQNEPIGNPQKGLIYFNQASGKFYRWTGSTFTAVNDQFISGISVNNTPVTPVNGNVDITVEGGDQVSVTTNNDGTFTIHVGETDYTINLNHTHENMAKLVVCEESDLPSTLDPATIYAQVDDADTPTEIQSLWIAGLEFAGGSGGSDDEPRLTSPRSGAVIDFEGQSTVTLLLKGKNLMSALTLAVTGDFTVSVNGSTVSSISASDANNGVTLTLTQGSGFSGGTLAISSVEVYTRTCSVEDSEGISLLEAIKLTGTQWLQTDFVPTTATDIEMKLKFTANAITETTDETAINFLTCYTLQGTNKQYAHAATTKEMNVYTQYAFSPIVSASSATKVSVSKTDFILDKSTYRHLHGGSLTFIAGEGGTSYTGNTPAVVAQVNPLTIGLYHTSGGVDQIFNKFDLTIYEFTVKENNVILRHYVPAMVAGVPGLYDTVTGHFASSKTSTPVEVVTNS